MAKLSLPPGFRFHPTDAELVSYYLKRKVYGRRIEFESIGDVDLYRFEPWDLPEMSRLQTKDLEWYFFCPRDRKYPNGSRTNRATEQGYWKATGKDRGVSSGARNVGMKKTLVYYKGRAPKGERTNWVIHEYRLNDTECERIQAVQNGFVLCRLYKKSGAGPKNGEQYGAPVEEDDWETGEHSSDENRSEMINFHSNMIQSYGHDTPEKEFLESDQRLNDHHGVKLNEVLTEVQDRETALSIADPCVIESWTGPSGQCNPVDGSAAGFVDEEDILCQILELAENKVSDVYDVSESNVLTESGQIDGFIGKDGDFFEMDDLLAPLRSDDVTEVERRGHPLDSSMQLSPGERRLEWQSQTQVHLNALEGTEFTPLSDLQLTGVRHQLEKFVDCATEESGSKVGFWDASVESQSPFISCGINSNPQAAADILVGSSDLYASKLDAPCHGSSLDEDLNYEDVLEVLEQFKGSRVDKEPLNLEALADNMQRGIGSSDMSSNLALQDGIYFDAMTDFFGERQNPDLDFLHQAANTGDLTSFESSYENVTQAQNKAGSQSFEDAVPSEATLEGKLILNWVSRGNAAESESTQREQVGTVNALHLSSTNADALDIGTEGKQTSKAFDLFYNYLGSLQGLPASAADLSPRVAASVNSISVRAMDVRAVAVTCTCTKDGLSSVCMSCSVTKDKKKGSFVRSLSFREKTVERTNAGFFMVAVLGVIWAFFWLLMFGGAWKLFGSVYRLVWS